MHVHAELRIEMYATQHNQNKTQMTPSIFTRATLCYSAGISRHCVSVCHTPVLIIIQHLYSAIVSYAGCRGACGAS